MERAANDTATPMEQRMLRAQGREHRIRRVINGMIPCARMICYRSGGLASEITAEGEHFTAEYLTGFS